MKTHTQTPWHSSVLFRSNLPESYAVLTNKWGAPLVAICDQGDQVEQKANAEFIVKACNSHEALVAALRDAERWMTHSLTELNQGNAGMVAGRKLPSTR